jgi:hypothetical protein
MPTPWLVPDDAVQRYVDARVEFAQTLADAYRHHAENPEVFVAGVQYALDKMLSSIDRVKDVDFFYNYHHLIALDILQKAKRGEPQ